MNYIYEEREPFCSVHGCGSISSDGHLFAGISYIIECWQQTDGVSHKTGLIDADLKTTALIRGARNNVLILETGEEVSVAIVGNDTGFLEIELQDPIEGCMAQSDVKQMEDVR